MQNKYQAYTSFVLTSEQLHADQKLTYRYIYIIFLCKNTDCGNDITLSFIEGIYMYFLFF